MKVFLDASAFAKRYISEQGSEKVLALCQQAESLVVSIICLPELVSALSRLIREKKLTKAAYRQLKNEAMADMKDVDICQITAEILGSVVSLLEDHPLRTLDAIHVACALKYQPDVFVSADHRQLSAARKAGNEGRRRFVSRQRMMLWSGQSIHVPKPYSFGSN